MRLSVVSSRIDEYKDTNTSRRKESGITLIEVMIVIVIAAVIVTFAVPSFNNTIEKREVTAAAEEVASFISYVQSEAVKRNEKVNFSWYSPGGHDDDWCIGASLAPQSTPCDCRETDPTDVDFCSIDSVPYRMVQTDFLNMSEEFIHMNPAASNFSFDPIRGIVTDVADPESVDGDYLFYVHSPRKNADNKRLFELQMRVNVTGHVSICTDPGGRASSVGGYPTC